MDAIDASIEERVDRAVKLAESSPDPLPEDALKDVYWDSAREEQMPKEIDAQEQQERLLQMINDKE